MEENKEIFNKPFTNEEGETIPVDAEVFHLNDSTEEMDVVKLHERITELQKEILDDSISDEQRSELQAEVNEIEKKLGLDESVTEAA